MTLSLRSLLSVLVLGFALSLTGCASKKTQKGEDSAAVSTTDQDPGNGEGLNLELNADSDSGKAGPLETVYFDFNSSRLGSDARQKLQENAEFLKNNPDVEIQIEGHADERGSVQYNLALGEKRAEVTKDYLVAMGVSSDRITTISFGKERPIAFGHDESSWGQNRRANFVVTAK